VPKLVNLFTDLKEECHVRAKSIWAVVMRGTLRFGSAILISVITTATANAQSVHYAPGAFNIRDFALPGPGLYGAI